VPSDLERFVRDQKMLVDLLGARLLFVEAPDGTAEPVLDVEVRPGDQLRARLRWADGHETWSQKTKSSDLTGDE
jgi:hypothetical protein